MRPTRGIPLLLIILLMHLLYQGREAFSEKKLPAFSVETSEKIWISLQSGFPSQGIHQFSDGSTLQGVIQMTIPERRLHVSSEARPEIPLRSGEVLKLVEKEGEIATLIREWMPAGQRMTLGIPLHPDAMVLSDWEFLPGAGPHLARAIEEDRQRNGGFGEVFALERVRGVGPKRIDAWKEFFSKAQVSGIQGEN